jgi:hypothetical protein
MNRIIKYIKENKSDIVIGSVLFLLAGIVIVATAMEEQNQLKVNN